MYMKLITGLFSLSSLIPHATVKFMQKYPGGLLLKNRPSCVPEIMYKTHLSSYIKFTYVLFLPSLHFC